MIGPICHEDCPVCTEREPHRIDVTRFGSLLPEFWVETHPVRDPAGYAWRDYRTVVGNHTE